MGNGNTKRDLLEGVRNNLRSSKLLVEEDPLYHGGCSQKVAFAAPSFLETLSEVDLKYENEPHCVHSTSIFVLSHVSHMMVV
jgi:hypothetical protein